MRLLLFAIHGHGIVGLGHVQPLLGGEAEAFVESLASQGGGLQVCGQACLVNHLEAVVQQPRPDAEAARLLTDDDVDEVPVGVIGTALGEDIESPQGLRQVTQPHRRDHPRQLTHLRPAGGLAVG